MKRLFYSKTFKKNLSRWLMGYVGILLLLTVAVTYSKYASSISANDSVRISKFNITVNDIGSLSCENDVCSTGTYRPTTYIPYEFEVNTEFEVKTLLVINITIDKEFLINNVYEIINENEIALTNGPDYTQNTIKDENDNVIGYKITITKEINIDNNSDQNFKYKLLLKYKNDGLGYISITNDILKDAVKIGYSATQIATNYSHASNGGAA